MTDPRQSPWPGDPAQVELPLLHADASCVVVAKPAGLLVHNAAFAGPRELTCTELVRTRFEASLVPVHRLDRGTSGVLVFACGAAAARDWQRALDTAEKRYLALVRGVLREALTVDHAFADEDGVRREARTAVAPLAASAVPRCALVLARPFTGRTHQVRRHLKHLSHPVIGDANYGKGALNRAFAAEHGLRRLALHARSLRLVHPVTGVETTFRAALPADLDEPLRRIFGEVELRRALAAGDAAREADAGTSL